MGYRIAFNGRWQEEAPELELGEIELRGGVLRTIKNNLIRPIAALRRR